MSEESKRFTLHYDETTGRYHVTSVSGNPIYNQDIVTATELARLDVIDKAVTEWIDCVDAEAIWQDMKKSVDSEGK